MDAMIMLVAAVVMLGPLALLVSPVVSDFVNALATGKAPKPWSKEKRVGYGIMLVLSAVLFCYMALPELSPRAGFSLWLGFAVVGIAGSLLRAGFHGLAVTAWLGASVVVTCLAMFSTSTTPAYSQAYRDLLGKPSSVALSEAFPLVDTAQAPLVSASMARAAMEKRLAELPALGSQFQVGQLAKQLYRGQLVWVAFLEYNGLTKSFVLDAAPGYVMVSASDPSDVALVQEVNGQKLALRYLENGAFLHDVARRAWLTAPTFGQTNLHPELDEDGRPYFVVTLTQRKVGMSGADAVGVLTVDAQTGDTQRYGLDNVPAWVDQVQPAALIAKQISDWGEFVNGWWNPTNEGQLRISGEVDLVYRNGQPFWVTGLTSTGSDSGVVGFIAVNARTKEALQFDLATYAESLAAQAMENVNPEKKYRATNPLPFLVEGVPTYVAALADAQGIVRAYGMANMLNHQSVATGTTLAATLRAYQARNATDRVGSALNQTGEANRVEGIVTRIAQEGRNGVAHYFLQVSTQDSTTASAIFTASSDLSPELVLTKEGDQVRLTYVDAGGRLKGLTAFDNINTGE